VRLSNKMPRDPHKSGIPKDRSSLDRKSKTLAAKRLIGEEPVLGIIDYYIDKKTKKKPTLKKLNSKGQVIKKKAHPAYFRIIKQFIKQNHSRKGSTRQAILKYIITNYGEPNSHALSRALQKGINDKKLIRIRKGRYNLSKSERKKKSKKAKKPKSKKRPKKSTQKKESKKKDSKKKDSKKKDSKKKDSKKKDSKKKDSKKKDSKTKVKSNVKVKPVKKAPTTTKVAKVKVSKVATARGVPKTKSRASDSTSTTLDSTSSGDLVWVWQYYDGGFHNYDPEASNTVEGVYQEYLNSPYTCDVRAVQSGQWQYEIDFRIMIQTNIQHESHTKRRIRRIQISASEKTNKQKNYGGDEKYVHVPEKKRSSSEK